jgi:hypothetical protein
MALNPKFSTPAQNASVDAVAALLNGGYLRLYDGAQPADGDAADGGATLLAELQFGNPAFGAAVGGIATANPITADADANATGVAAWYRCFMADGVTKVHDGTVGVAGCNLNLNSVNIQIHALVSVTSFTLEQPGG